KFLTYLRFTIQTNIGVLKDYQPHPFIESSHNKLKRDCYDRLSEINNILPLDREDYSYLDIGCHTGFFLFKLVNNKRGFGLGIDHGITEIMTAKQIADSYDYKNVNFMNYEINPHNINSLPNFDVVIFLSVFHHFVRYYGKENALDILNSIAEKTKKYLIFETGQPNEKSSWAKKLDFMGKDYNEWIKNKLIELNFKEIYYDKEFSTSVSEIKRTLFIAKKNF
ncbi:MAG: hypothetical protein CML94_00565, partial [Rhodobiaceae bacterium]|nr:hypothetical protein [Rhodobiaceae bacterium]